MNTYEVRANCQMCAIFWGKRKKISKSIEKSLNRVFLLLFPENLSEKWRPLYFPLRLSYLANGRWVEAQTHHDHLLEHEHQT